MTPGELNYRQRLFVEEYLVDLNGTQAAIRAGYSVDTAGVIASENLAKPNIRAAVEEGFALKAQRTRITADSIMVELAKIGYANMADYMQVGTSGDPVLKFGELSRDQAAALAEVTVEGFVDGRGEDARDVKRVKFKLHDKKGALVDLAKLIGAYRDRIEHTGANGGPIAIAHVEEMDDAQLARIAAEAVK